MVGEFSNGQTRNGEVIEGPSTEYVESVEEYNHPYDCIKALIIIILSTNINFHFMEFDMEQYNPDENGDNV